MTKSLTSVLFFSVYVVILLPIVLYSGSLAIIPMFDIPNALGISFNAALWLGVWSLGIVGSIYAIFGGLKAVTISDTVNAIGLLIDGLMIPVLGQMIIGYVNRWSGTCRLYKSC